MKKGILLLLTLLLFTGCALKGTPDEVENTPDNDEPKVYTLQELNTLFD